MIYIQSPCIWKICHLRGGDDFVDEVLDASIDPGIHIKKAEGSGMSLNHIAGDAETGEFLWLLICQFH